MEKIATYLTLPELKRVRLLFPGISDSVARIILRRSVVTVPVWRDDDCEFWIDKEITTWLISVVVKRARLSLSKKTRENVRGMKAIEFLQQVGFKLCKIFGFVATTCFLFPVFDLNVTLYISKYAHMYYQIFA